MKVIVKTLKGEKFPIEVEASQTIGQVKATIESTKSELSGATMKLICSGKVLKDEDSLETCGVKENDFLVVMVTKPKKVVAAPVATSAAAAPPAASTETPTNAAAAAAADATTTPAAAAAPAAPPAAPARAAAPEFSDGLVANLVALGFPETEVRHCLRASNGNPDIAVEFLTNGIPAAVPAAASAGGGQPLAALRAHPQFNELKRLVQSNPQMLQQVLTQIGQQQPALLEEINSNQAAFLALMNEPITEGSAAPAMGAGNSPGEMAAMMQNMEPGQLQMMAQMMGMTPDQVSALGRMIGQMPPEELQNYMQQAMGGGGGGGGQQQVLRLTAEEMAAVDRLTEMGFDRTEAAQAFLACDKNEALAANLLMDSANQDGGFGGAPPAPPGGANGGDDDEDMYS